MCAYIRILLLTLVVLAGCSPPTLPTAPRGEDQQLLGAVAVYSTCAPIADRYMSPELEPAYDRYGSEPRAGNGVLLDAGYVVTALHVVECISAWPNVWVTSTVGTVRAAVVEVREDLDVAYLRAWSAIGFEIDDRMKAAPLAPPTSGTACVQATDQRVCGELRRTDGRWILDAYTSRGTSGAGVYQGGALVGLVIRGGEVDGRAYTVVTTLP